MAKSIIDQLIVTLGLDATQYKKGAAEAEASQKKFRESTKKSGDEISSALKGVGKEVAGLFIAFESVKGLVTYMANLNGELADLGRFSRNIGMSAHDVNGWGLAIESAGGNAKEAQADLGKLASDIVAFNTQGTISPLLQLLQRTGVAIQDAQGKTRPLIDIYKDLGDQLRQTDRATAHTWAATAALSDSTFNLITTEAKARQDLIDKAEANNKVTEAATEAAAKTQQKWREIGQEIKGAGTELLTAVQPAVVGVLDAVKGGIPIVKDLFNTIVDGYSLLGKSLGSIELGGGGTLGGFLADQWDQFKQDLSHLKGKIHENAQTAASLNGSAGTVVTQSTPVASVDAGVAASPGIPGAKGTRNNNPGNLRWAGQRKAIGKDKDGFAIFRNWQDGVDASRAQLSLDSSRGMNSVRSIISSWAPNSENNTAAYIADVAGRLGVGADDKLNGEQVSAMANAIFIHEGSLRAARGAGSAAAASSGGGAGARSETNIDIGSIAVHTQATDANGIAGSIGPAVKRKVGVVAQANSGMS